MSIQAKPLHSVGVRDEAQGRSALHPGQGQLRRRPVAAGHALSLAGAEHLPARRDQEHRHQRGHEGARGQGRDHRQGPRGCRARLVADLPRLRQADGARDRQGALPVSGSCRRVRRDARGGRRRRRGRAGRLCAAARRRRSVHREDRQGAAQAGPREQDEPHLPLGSRRQGRHRARDGVQPEADQGAPLVPAVSSCAARAVRVRRALRHDGAAAVPRDVAGAARLSHGAVARHRHRRRQDPCDLAGSRRRFRQQGAGLSRDTCARSSARSRSDARSSGSRRARRT